MNTNVALCIQLPTDALWGDSCYLLCFSQQDVIYPENYYRYMS